MALLFIVLCFANWRISSMIANEEGPANLLGRLRNWTGVRYTKEGVPYGTTSLSRGILCVWCVSVWVGVMQLFLLLYQPALLLVFCVPCALSTGAVITETFISR